MTLTDFLAIAAFVVLLLLGYGYIKQRNKLERMYHKFRHRGLRGRKWPIETVSLDRVSPVFKTGEYGLLAEKEVTVLAGKPAAGVSAFETSVLAALAMEARNIFEFGTCTGATTYLLAKNSKDDARVTTLTLAPDQVGQASFAGSDIRKEADMAIEESCYSRFLYTDTDVESKVDQLFLDSKDLDEKKYRERMDLIFIDGAHTYSYIKSDSRKALAMIRPGGLIVWHDYRGPHETAGVFRALNEMAAELPLFHIQGTNMVFYRHS
ncbi:MAG: class I SAM-dependent methyltransferase [Planctomycetota bacterium]